MFLVSLGVLGGVFVSASLSPRKYEAELKLFVKRERVDAPVTGERAAPATRPDVTEAEITSEIELFWNRSLLEKVVEASHLLPPGALSSTDRPKRLTQAVRTLEKELTIAPIKKTNLISVRYTAKDPTLAAQVVNVAADLYLEKHTALFRNQDASEFFSRQADYYRRALAEAQNRLSAFQQRHEISLLEQQKQANLGQITALEASFQETDSQIRDAERRIALLRQQRDSLPATIQAQSRMAKNEPLIDKLKGLLIDLENKHTELLTKYDPGHRLVQEIDRQIQNTRAALEGEQAPSVVDQTETVNPLRQSIEAELFRTQTLTAGSWARRANLAKELQYYRERQRTLERMTAEHNDYQRRVKVAEENYLLYQKKQEESRIADAMDRQKILNVSIVERAVPPALPVDQHKPLILVLGAAAATFAGIGAALIADYFNRPVRGVEELTVLTNLPVLATLSKVRAACS